MDQNSGQKENTESKNDNDNGTKTKNTDQVDASLTRLVDWNISKALENNPNLDLMSAMRSAQARLESDSCEVVVSPQAGERHVACALLAWQQLGHSSAESLLKFMEARKSTAAPAPAPTIMPSKRPSLIMPISCSSYVDSKTILESYSCGPVIRLPLKTEPQIVMRMDQPCSSSHCNKNSKDLKEKEIMKKIEAACCLKSACGERLAKVEAQTMEIRERAATLAQREAKRVELLQRAEAAWKDLELGYERRLGLAQEKEDDLTKQLQKNMEERNGYKNFCTALAEKLKTQTEIAEIERQKLTEIEQKLYDLACTRMKLSEECTRLDGTLTDHQCRAAQLDRDLKFQEQQTRWKVSTYESELNSAQALTNETERALREELTALRQQITAVSEQLIEEDHKCDEIKKLTAELRIQRDALIGDLDQCKGMCDGRMEGMIDQLKKKQEKLLMLQSKVLECRCQVPREVAVEAKRTPSLAALCHCLPEDKILDQCSCTSIRERLITSVLSDLFSGLQDDTSFADKDMPCQLLKCLEDKHNWDRASIVKSNLKNYFSNLLVGELDIAIATAIENYHVKWVGQTCADSLKRLPEYCDDPNWAHWQQRAIERRAEALANDLAQQLLLEQTEQLNEKAKSAARCAPPPCECEPSKVQQTFQCQVPLPWNKKKNSSSSGASSAKSQIGNALKSPASKSTDAWRQALNDVTMLRSQIEDLKKDTIKKEDLIMMQEKLTKIMQQTSNQDGENEGTNDINNYNKDRKTSVKKKVNMNTPKRSINRIQNVTSVLKTNNKVKPIKRFGQTFAVNTCLCTQKDPSKINRSRENKNVSHQPSAERTDNTKNIPDHDIHPIIIPCPSNSICFHKPPSNTSLDKLLVTLKKWKDDLDKHQENTSSLENKSDTISKVLFQEDDSQSENIQVELEHKTKNQDSETNLVFVPVKKKSSVSNKTNRSVIHNTFKLSENVIIIEDSQKLLKGVPLINSISHNDKKSSHDATHENVYKDSLECYKVICQPEKSYNGCHVSKILPTEKLSEYIATVNLDKSNEDNGKDDIKKVKSKSNRNLKGSTVIPLNTYNTTNNKSKCDKKFANKNSSNVCSARKEKRDNNGCITNVVKDEKVKFTKDDKVNVVNQNKTAEESFYDNKAPGGESNYNIQFLGVTLTDLSSNALEESHILDRKKILELNCKKSEGIELSKDKSCQRISFLNVNKSLDAQSFDEAKIHKESCICCKSSDETKDLEENTFQLLQEHLKQKFEYIKNQQSFDGVIPPNDEEQIFSKILTKVRKVISESTNRVYCNCNNPEESSQGSWHRAYGLLQEYLKIKIKRVQCYCSSEEEDKNVVLPNVLEKVCQLIENDFQRLQKIYKPNKKQNDDGIGEPFETPVKDTDKVCPNTQANEAVQVAQQANTSISIQPSPFNINMISQACDPIDPNTKKVHIVDNPTVDEQISIQKIAEMSSNNNDFLQPGLDQSTSYSSQLQKPIPLLPYIGLTLDCSCDTSIGPCVCIKSTLKPNEEINDLWNKSKTQVSPDKLTYMLKGKSNNEDNYEVYDDPLGDIFIKNILNHEYNKHQTVNEAETDTYSMRDNEFKDIETETSLGDSNFMLNLPGDQRKLVNNIMIDTQDEHSLDASLSKTEEDAVKWCDCYSTVKTDISTHLKNSINFPVPPIDYVVAKVPSEADRETLKAQCECEMVPICHVKLLVKDIETNLADSKCTCDAMIPEVCPVHCAKSSAHLVNN